MYQFLQHSSLQECESEHSQAADDWLGMEKYGGNKHWYRKKAKSFILHCALALSPSFLHQFWDSDQEPKPLSPTAYLDGLRGIAAAFVFVGHYAMPFQLPQMSHGYGDGGGNWNVLQLPIIRLLYSGTPMVVVFFIISGFVLSLKPLTLIRNERPDRLLRSVASSVCRRGIRLYLPTLVSTFLVTIAVQYHLLDSSAFYTADFRPLRPVYHDTLWEQLLDWWHFVWASLTDPWPLRPFEPESNYGGHLWTIPFEFRSSLLLFLAVIALHNIKSLPSHLISAFLVCYCMVWQRWDVAEFICGMCLAKLHLYRTEKNDNFTEGRNETFRYIRLGLPWLALLIGLYLLSYPIFDGPRTPGYMWFGRILPLYHYPLTIGAILIVGSVGEIPAVKLLLTSPVPQYLGRISFALYIVHEPLVQMFGWSLVPQLWRITGQASKLQYHFGFCLGFLMFLPVVIWIADVFWRLVDKPSMALARWVVVKCSIEHNHR